MYLVEKPLALEEYPKVNWGCETVWTLATGAAVGLGNLKLDFYVVVYVLNWGCETFWVLVTAAQNSHL